MLEEYEQMARLTKLSHQRVVVPAYERLDLVNNIVAPLLT